jgi:uncharacterized protein YjbJ (UPF0337 family)
MDENRVEGAARKLAGKAQGAVGDATGDTKMQAEGRLREAAGSGQQAVGEAQDAGAKVMEGASDELARLRAQVETLLNERVTPALAHMADTAEGYARDARAAVQVQADNVAATIQERPLTIMAVVAASAWLLGRISGTTHVHHHHHG